MLNEVKQFFDNVNHFRQLLKEGVDENTVVDAINKHKIVYIYYAGDNTLKKGYRTIRGYTLGKTTKEGGDYLLLRAWQEAGASDSNKKYSDPKGRTKHGWRLFRVDKITSFLPTGKYFSTDESKMPEGYNPNDSQMRDIVAAVQISTGKPQTQATGIDSIEKPDVIKQKLPEPTSAFAGQKEKFRYFSNAGKKQREATADEIEHLWAIAKGIKKKSPEKLLVVTDENGDLVLKDENIKTKLPPESIVGNLKDLYIKYIKPNQKVDTSFFKKMENSAIKETNQKNPNKGTFFK